MLKKICFFTFTLFSLFIIFKHDVDAFNLRGSFYSRNRSNIVYQLRIGFIGNYGPNEDNWQFVSWAIDVDSTECFGISGCNLFKYFEQRGVASSFDPPYRFRWGTGCVDPLPRAVSGADYEGVPFYLPRGNPIDIGCYSSGICSNANAAKIAYWENHNGKYVPFTGWHNTNGCPDIPTYSIDGRVFIDDNGDGDRDAGEAYRNGLTVHKTGDGNPEPDSTHDDANGVAGYYRFFNLPSGSNYRVWLDIPSGYHCTNDCNRTGINLPPNHTIANGNPINFGIALDTGPIGGKVYIDGKVNGRENNQFDPGEGYSGATVFKDKGTNNQEKRTSDPDYNFGGLTGGSTHDIKLEDFPTARLNVEGDNPKRNVRVPNSNANFRLNFAKYTIKGHVYWDPDGNGISTTPYSKTVDLTVVGEGRNDKTNDNGAYAINGNPTDLTADGKQYTLRLTNQRSGDIVEGGRDQPVSITDKDEVVNFFLTRNAIPTYSLSGGLFDDTNDPGNRNSDPNISPVNPERITVTSTTGYNQTFPATSPEFNTGEFYLGGLSAGTYTVSFSGTRNNWGVSFHPLPYSNIVIGLGASCPGCRVNGQDAEDIDFGISQITQQDPWYQGAGGDMSDDKRSSVTIPSGYYFSITEGKLLSPGVIFNFDVSGNKSVKNWFVNSPLQNKSIKTSYVYVSRQLKDGKANQINLFGVGAHCGPDDGTGCQIDNPNGGYYYTDGKNIILDAIDFRANEDYIFRIDGNLTINTGATPWNIPNSTTAMFVVKGDIIVNSNVTHLEGIFSADGDFRVKSKSPAADSQLVIEGSVIANADKGVGKFVNQRDLGNSANQTTPSVKIIFRPDFVLNAPNLVRYSNYNFHEAPPSGQ